MFVRNFLSAGDYMEVVPIGLPVTLQYDVNGILEKVLFNYENDAVDITEDIKNILLSTKLVPRKVSVKTGTTWVKGVVYTDNHTASIGAFPECLRSEYIQEIKDNPGEFKFYAGSVSSMSTVFRGAVPIRQWLELSGFSTLPGYVIPSGLKEESFDRFLERPNYPFTYPLFQGYFIFKRNDVKYYNLGFKQVGVLSTSTNVDDEGKLKVDIKLQGHENLSVDYSDYIRMNIQPGVLLLLDESDKVLYSIDTDDQRKPLSYKTHSKITCPVCGKIYDVVRDGEVFCPDDHCNSRLYPRVNHFLRTIGLDEISRKRYDEITKVVGNIFSIVDVLDADEYADKEVTITLSQLLRSIVPENIISKFDAFDGFCNRCNNNIESVRYYIDNPTKANKDLKLYEGNTSYVKFLRWVEDRENAMDIVSLMMHDRVHIKESNMTLPNVAPIFRGNKILITGRFRHGSDDRIRSILSSYGADVVTRYDPGVSFVVVGDTKENISGPATRSALVDGKIVYEESDFFKRFEIDKDLAENL